MTRRKSRSRETHERMADFETTTDPKDCRVWAWGSVAIDDLADYATGIDIDSFMAYLDNRPSITYFHNLRFDGTFITDWLLRHDFRWVPDSPGAGEFTTLIDHMGKWYSLTYVSRNSVRTEFRDSLKKIPLPVARIAKAYDLEESKGEIDYDAPRPVGHALTEQESDYLYRDIVIVAQALRVQRAAGMRKLTVGADALKEYKDIITKDQFKAVFPVLDPLIDNEIRKAYRGGFTYADPRTSSRIVGAGIVLDVNSLYPSVMYYRPIPYGVPDYTDGPPPDPDALYITSITFTAKIKPNHIPCIQVKQSLFFNATEYLTDISEPVTLAVTSVDLALWREQYDIDILAFHGTFTFHSATGLFTDYIDKWMNVKANSVGGMREIAKLHLNSLYGKFATNTNVTGKYPVLDHDRVTLVTGEPEHRDPVYTPAGVFITAWARDVTLRAAQAEQSRFMYADTDSLHLAGTDLPRGLTVHPTDLGAWKHEATFTRATYVRAKQYAEELDDGSTSVHIAGLPASIADQLCVDDLLRTREFRGKLIPRAVPGGTVLEDTTFTLKVH